MIIISSLCAQFVAASHPQVLVARSNCMGQISSSCFSIAKFEVYFKLFVDLHSTEELNVVNDVCSPWHVILINSLPFLYIDLGWDVLGHWFSLCFFQLTLLVLWVGISMDLHFSNFMQPERDHLSLTEKIVNPVFLSCIWKLMKRSKIWCSFS